MVTILSIAYFFWQLSLEDADLLKEGCTGQTTSHRLCWASCGPVTDNVASLCTAYMCAPRTSRLRADGAPSTSRAPLTLPRLQLYRNWSSRFRFMFFGPPHLRRRRRRFPPPPSPSPCFHHHYCHDIAPTNQPLTASRRDQPAPARLHLHLPPPPA
jgi:hypothetical protein